MDDEKVSGQARYDVAEILGKLRSIEDPITFGIILNIFKHKEITALDIKKKMGIKGSRIYYYLNKLLEQNLIEETGKEVLTSHLSRSKYRISPYLIDLIKELRHNEDYAAYFSYFNLLTARAMIENKIRKITKVFEDEKKDYPDTMDQDMVYIIRKDELAVIKEWQDEIKNSLPRETNSHFDDWIINATHLALFSIVSLD